MKTTDMLLLGGLAFVAYEAMKSTTAQAGTNMVYNPLTGGYQLASATIGQLPSTNLNAYTTAGAAVGQLLSQLV